ncbi:hypothetical protein [uncultured Microbacterium sp.]|uniref:hypothetical protein n=1 Tax=uncultured Microbacterium sp. TaxID=191216 RepID=UPI0035CA190C
MTSLAPAQPREPLAMPRPLPIEVFDRSVDAARHAGRSAVRREVLAMMPVDGREALLPGPIDSVAEPGGLFWALRARNDLTIALRTASFPTARAARNDAIELLAHAHRFDLIDVRSPTRGIHSHWIALDDRVILVAGQAWRGAGASAARALRETLALLPANPAGETAQRSARGR